MSRIVTGRVESTGLLVDYVGDSVLHATQISLEHPGTAFRALLALSAEDDPCMIGFRTADCTIAISVSNGHIVHTSAEDEDEDEALGITLLEESLLPREKIIRAAENAEREGLSLAKSIFSLSLMPPREMVRAIKATIQRHVNRALGSDTADFTVARGALAGRKALRPGPTHVLVKAVLHEYLDNALKLYYAADLDALLTPLKQYYLRVPEVLAERGGLVGFRKREVHTLVALLDGGHRLSEIARLSVMSKNAVFRLIFQLGVMGFLELLDESTHEELVLTEEEQLDQIFREKEAGNLFERLEVHWSTPIRQVKRSCEALADEYGPGSPSRRQGGEVATLAGKIWAQIEQAYEQLKDLKRRQSYRATIVEKTLIRHSADLLAAQARTAELQRRFNDARELFQTAHELDGDPAYIKALRVLDAREHEWMKRKREKQDR